MDLQPVANDAFRFVDIQTPRKRNETSRGYIISRSALDFSRSHIEERLALLRRDENYASEIKTVVTTLIDEFETLPLFTGFLKALEDFAEILADTTLEEEAKRRRFRAKSEEVRAADTQDAYLRNPASKIWDFYVAFVIAADPGTTIGRRTQQYLLTALRVAAAHFELSRSTSATDGTPLSQLSVASVSLTRDLLDPLAVRMYKSEPVRPEADERGRHLQNSLVETLIRHNLAFTELNEALRDPFVPTERTNVVAPIAAAPDAPKVKGVSSLELKIPRDRLSATTSDLLTASFSARMDANSVVLDPLPALSALEASIRETGDRLYRSSDPDTVVHVQEQLELIAFSARMGAAEDIAERIASLPLLVSPTPATGKRILTDSVNPNVRPLGVAQLKVIKQTLLRYQPGEVAHVENVLRGEERERLHSVKQVTEESFTMERESTTSSEHDLQTTDRFELSEETTTAVSQERKNETGITVTASYGPVSISANTQYSDTGSRQQGQKISRSFARDVVDRTVERVQQRVREERTRKTTLQIEETNRHKLSGAKDKSTVGIYRWIDKVYWAQVHVYGTRLMLEFLIPEPAAVFLYGSKNIPSDPSAVSPPKPINFTAHDIRRDNYTALAREYGAVVENPPPAAEISVHGSRTDNDTSERKVEFADGWFGVRANIMATWIEQGAGVLNTLFGNCYWKTQDIGWQYLTGSSTGAIPILVETIRISSYSVSIQVVVVPSAATFQKWQLETYKAIADAYALRKSEYDAYLAAKSSGHGGQSSLPDQEARKIERQEIQRACTELLTRDHFSGDGGLSFSNGWPEIDFPSAQELGKKVLFLQQSFEWEQMTYVFYPYYWAEQSRWPGKLTSAGGDSLFSRFLSAGYARAVVPVRPLHESDVAYYLEMGEPWKGGEPPLIGDDTYLDIIEELKESLDAPDGGLPEGEPWQFKVPTSLVVVDDSGVLPSWPDSAPSAPLYAPSEETCGGVPYNAAQWKDAKTIAGAIRDLGYQIKADGDQAEALRAARSTVRAMQRRFNEIGAASVLGRSLKLDGIVGPCTLRALTHFTALNSAGKWPGVS